MNLTEHVTRLIDRLSDESGQMTFNEVVSGKGVTKSELKSDDGMCPLFSHPPPPPKSPIVNLKSSECQSKM